MARTHSRTHAHTHTQLGPHWWCASVKLGASQAGFKLFPLSLSRLGPSPSPPGYRCVRGRSPYILRGGGDCADFVSPTQHATHHHHGVSLFPFKPPCPIPLLVLSFAFLLLSQKKKRPPFCRGHRARGRKSDGVISRACNILQQLADDKWPPCRQAVKISCPACMAALYCSNENDIGAAISALIINYNKIKKSNAQN